MDPEPALLSRLEQLFLRVMFKVQVVIQSATSFVLMSTVTAMTVRTLLSSGVVIMFPLVMLMERLGLWGVELRVSGGSGRSLTWRRYDRGNIGQ